MTLDVVVVVVFFLGCMNGEDVSSSTLDFSVLEEESFSDAFFESTGFFRIKNGGGEEDSTASRMVDLRLRRSDAFFA